MSTSHDHILDALADAGQPPPDPTLPFLTRDEKDRVRFHIDRLGARLVAETPFATGGGQLYVYRDGVYRPGGERDVLRRIRSALGPHWQKQRALDTLAWIEHDLPSLEESPPLDKINVLNGMLYLDGEPFLDPHDPEILSPVQIAAAYDPSATCPAIDAFLSAVLPEGAIPQVHELIGLLTVPDQRMQKAVMLLGPSGTGKSTLLNLMRALLGRENVSAVSLHQLDENTFATADLYGKLANIFADLDSRALKSSSMFKSITGGDAIRGERKRRDPFTFTPYARLLFSANEVPPTADSSAAFFDRWLIIPLERTFRGTAAQDVDILASMTTPQELSGLLNHALAGLERVRKHGFTKTEATERAAERFAVDADSVAGFLEECCLVEPEVTYGRKQMHRTYKDWCQEAGRHPFAAAKFNSRLDDLLRKREAPWNVYPLSGYPTWRGIAVKPSHETPGQ